MNNKANELHWRAVVDILDLPAEQACDELHVRIAGLAKMRDSASVRGTRMLYALQTGLEHLHDYLLRNPVQPCSNREFVRGVVHARDFYKHWDEERCKCLLPGLHEALVNFNAAKAEMRSMEKLYETR